MTGRPRALVTDRVPEQPEVREQRRLRYGPTIVRASVARDLATVRAMAGLDERRAATVRARLARPSTEDAA